MDLDTFVWSLLDTKGKAPAARAFHTAVSDDAGQSLFIYGGCSPQEIPFGELFRYDVGE